MIISFTGCDGAGKTTHIDLLKKRICNSCKLSGINLLDITNGVLVYENIRDIDLIYKQLEKYDVIVTRFYMKSKLCNEEQRKIRLGSDSVFNNSERIRKVLDCVKTDSDIWREHVISKLHERNKIIIVDRYYYDEVAYRSMYNLGLYEVEQYFCDAIKPDLSYALLASFDEIRQRNNNREDGSTPIFRDNEKLQLLLERIELVANMYSLEKIYTDGKNISQTGDEICDIFLKQYLK